jgi:hypothetical protein
LYPPKAFSFENTKYRIDLKERERKTAKGTAGRELHGTTAVHSKFCLSIELTIVL